MTKQRSKLGKHIASLLGFGLCAAIEVAAQGQRGGGGFGGGGVGGGFGGGAGGGRTAGSSATSRTYYNNGTVGEAMISVDPETRRLIVITDEATGQYVSQVVTNLDRPKPQVLIKVVFLEVTHNDSLDIGIEGSYNKNYGNSWISGLTTNFGVVGNAIVPTSITPTRTSSSFAGTNLFGLAAAGASGSPGAGIYQIFSQNYSATLRAIAQAGKTEVLSRPSILARNNQPATITVGQSVPLITSTTYSALNNLPISSYSYTSVGIILKVTPFINNEGMVEMIVSPQISELADRSLWVQTAPGVFAPVIDTRSADTVVVTPDGQTVIIGGLIQKSKMMADSKIPILGDIPILGNLFKHKVKSESKTELIIFLTPHIVVAPSQLVALSVSERDKAMLAPKAFTEKELDQFLDGLPSKKKDGKLPKDRPPNHSPETIPSEEMTPEMREKARELLYPTK